MFLTQGHSVVSNFNCIALFLGLYDHVDVKFSGGSAKFN